MRSIIPNQPSNVTLRVADRDDDTTPRRDLCAPAVARTLTVIDGTLDATAAAAPRRRTAATLLADIAPQAAAELVSRTRGSAYEAIGVAVGLFTADKRVSEESRERAKNLWFDLVAHDENSLTIRQLRANVHTISGMLAALEGDIAEADEHFCRAELAAQQ